MSLKKMVAVVLGALMIVSLVPLALADDSDRRVVRDPRFFVRDPFFDPFDRRIIARDPFFDPFGRRIIARDPFFDPFDRRIFARDPFFDPFDRRIIARDPFFDRRFLRDPRFFDDDD